MMCFPWIPLRRAAAMIILATGIGFAAGMPAGDARELPLQSIVGGHRLQPTEGELKTLDYSDVTRSEATEVNQLYRQLLQCAPADCTDGAPSATGGMHAVTRGCC